MQRAKLLAAGVFRIGEKYLGLSMPEAWRALNVDEGPLLADILASGLHGKADENRSYSARITFNTLATGRVNNGLFFFLFPGVEYLQSAYPYAKKHPILLPVAWVHRLLRYLWLQERREDFSTAKSVRIWQERIRLMQKYGIM